MPSTYRVFSFKVFPVKSGSEILIAELSQIGFDSFEEKHDGIDAYIVEANFQTQLFDSIGILSSSDFKINYSSKILENKNWNEIWESNFEPIIINKNCCVRADFHSPLNLKYEIIITPKMSFGTGHHETTSMVISYILKLDLNNLKVLDVGCGTGILSILSEKKEANLVDAIDIEKWCYENTLENLRLNNCKFINVYHGNIDFVNKRKYDIILANINKNVIMREIPIYTNSLRTGGQLIMSGFYDNDFNDINDKAKSLKLNFISKKKKNLWTAIHYLKS